ncbi:MAG: hypothetical protein JW713_05555, partial [Pontiellaceae bacterium]|nr:hypothetical protein [Pontiellaceae bacterium]
ACRIAFPFIAPPGKMQSGQQTAVVPGQLALALKPFSNNPPLRFPGSGFIGRRLASVLTAG